MKRHRKKLPKVKCGEAKLGNAAWFKYLGSIFSVDGSQRRDIKRRIALAMSRCGALRQIFDSKALDLQLKLAIYKTAHHSTLQHSTKSTAHHNAEKHGATHKCNKKQGRKT